MDGRRQALRYSQAARALPRLVLASTDLLRLAPAGSAPTAPPARRFWLKGSQLWWWISLATIGLSDYGIALVFVNILY